MQIGWRSRRALYQIHLWAGLVLAIPLLLSALTGAVLLFKFDVMRWLVPTAAQSVKLTADQISELGEELEQRFGVRLRSARLPDDRIGVVEVYLMNDDAAYFDPVTRTVVRERSRHRDVFDVLFDLHHELLAGKVGRTPLGIVALGSAILLLIGVTLWLFPR